VAPRATGALPPSLWGRVAHQGPGSVAAPAGREGSALTRHSRNPSSRHAAVIRYHESRVPAACYPCWSRSHRGAAHRSWNPPTRSPEARATYSPMRRVLDLYDPDRLRDLRGRQPSDCARSTSLNGGALTALMKDRGRGSLPMRRPPRRHLLLANGNSEVAPGAVWHTHEPLEAATAMHAMGHAGGRRNRLVSPPYLEQADVVTGPRRRLSSAGTRPGGRPPCPQLRPRAPGRT